MRRAHPDVVLSLVALAAVGALLGLAELLTPPRVSFAEAEEGARVEVLARVLDLHDGPRARRLMLTDGAHRMPAFAPHEPPLERGDVVRAVGIVSRDERGLLLSLEEVEVAMPTARVVRQPADLAARPHEFDGARVVVEGEVRAGMLVGGGARVRLAGDGAPPEGDVVVTGAFRYRESDASYVVWVESWTWRS